MVEDNIINQKVATKMLTSLGCSVTVQVDSIALRSSFFFLKRLALVVGVM